MKSRSWIRNVEGVPGKHRFETRQCSKPIAFHLSNVTNQQDVLKKIMSCGLGNRERS